MDSGVKLLNKQHIVSVICNNCCVFCSKDNTEFILMMIEEHSIIVALCWKCIMFPHCITVNKSIVSPPDVSKRQLKVCSLHRQDCGLMIL